MANRHANLILNNENATRRFAQAMASHLRPGDTVLLSGHIGAGKTFLARCLIQFLQDAAEDVPSPTYTLVQAYDTKAGEIWHCDLYRIGSVDEIEELGLIDAMSDAICLIEWPDRLGHLVPQQALSMTMTSDPASATRRNVTLAWSDPKWAPLAHHLTHEAAL